MYLSGTLLVYVFIFKHTTSYDMRFSDWSSDVCSSDLQAHGTHSRHEDSPAGGPRPSRLYRNTERGVIFGVCAGLADYFGISRFIVRIVAVIALFMFPPPTLFCYFKIGRASCRERVCQYV